MNQNKRLNIAIVGATGVVGEKIRTLLEERKFPVQSIKLLSSKRSAGTRKTFNQQEVVVEEATKDSFAGIDIAFFSAGGQVSKKLVPEAVKAGAIVIDNTSAYRMDDRVPLVVPEVNESALFSHEGIIANPNCSTIQMVVALAPIHRELGLNQVVVSTYQSVSGAGSQAIDEFEQEISDHLNKKEDSADLSSKENKPIAFNVLPQIDRFEDNGFTGEEMKMINESKKILTEPNLSIAATCVRVPVVTSHSESIYIEVDKEGITKDDLQDILQQSNTVTLYDDPHNEQYPTPLQATDKEDVFIGRIRQDLNKETGFHLWVVSDNLLKGAALNTVQIAESLKDNRRQ